MAARLVLGMLFLALAATPLATACQDPLITISVPPVGMVQTPCHVIIWIDPPRVTTENCPV